MFCKFCSKECASVRGRESHQRFCKMNPDRKDSPFKTLKQEPWIKGRTKDSDPTLKAASEKISAKMKAHHAAGSIAGASTKEYWTEEKRLEKSEWRKAYHEKNPSAHPNRKVAGNRAKMSYPEQIAFDWLTEMGIEFQHQTKVDRYYPDFIVGDLIIEIDGEHWHPVGNASDEARDKRLTELGFTVKRIRSSESIKDRLNEIFGSVG